MALAHSNHHESLILVAASEAKATEMSLLSSMQGQAFEAEVKLPEVQNRKFSNVATSLFYSSFIF